MHLRNTIVSGLALGAMFASQASAQGTAARVNPLLQPSSLPYGVPRFDLIRNDDFRAALDQGMREELADIERIASDTAPATFVNTMEALEREDRRGVLAEAGGASRCHRPEPAAVRPCEVPL